MKGFEGIRELASMLSRRLLATAIAGLKGFSAARTSTKFLLTILVLMVPMGIVLSRSLLHAIPTQSSIIVTSLDDPSETSGNGFCTLREAIDNANSVGVDTTGGDCDVPATSNVEITFLFPGTITLSSGLPQIASPLNLTIDGNVPITIDGASSYQVMAVNSAATLKPQQPDYRPRVRTFWRRRGRNHQ